MGELCCDILLEVIKNYKRGTGSVVYADETVINVISCENGKDRTDWLNLGKNLARILVQNLDKIFVLLDLMEYFDFHVQRITTRLLTALLKYELAKTHRYILKSPHERVQNNGSTFGWL